MKNKIYKRKEEESFNTNIEHLDSYLYRYKCNDVYEEDGAFLVGFYVTQEKKPNKILGDELLRLNPKLQKVYCIHRDHSSYDLQTDLEEHFSYIHCYDRQLIERSDKKLIVKYSKQESDSPLKYRRCDDGEFEVYDTPSAVWLVYNASDVLLFKILQYFGRLSRL